MHEFLSHIGVPKSHCARYSFWGGCGDPACRLKHDDSALSSAQASKAKTVLLEGASKLPSALDAQD